MSLSSSQQSLWGAVEKYQHFSGPEPTACVVKIEPEKQPQKFQENDVLLVYSCRFKSPVSSNFDLSINPAQIKENLNRTILSDLMCVGKVLMFFADEI